MKLGVRGGIQFEPLPGADNLTVNGRNGERFLTYQALAQKVDAERQRAENAELRAENAQLRAERYAARLREPGIEPD